MGIRLPSPPRKFTLLDAMILVASVAIWLSLTRYFAARTNMRTIWYFGNYGVLRMLRNQIALLLWVLSLTIIGLRLRSPRPTRRRLWSQPGFVACTAAILGVFLNALEVIVNRHADLRTYPAWDQFGMVVLWQEWPYVGPAVFGVWIALAWSGRWRAEPSTIDRLGRIVGVCWLIEYVVAEGQFGRWVQVAWALIERGRQ